MIVILIIIIIFTLLFYMNLFLLIKTVKKMKTIEVKIYGRSRFNFQNLFPSARFEGYECNIRFCYFTLNAIKSVVERVCSTNKIKIINIE